MSQFEQCCTIHRPFGRCLMGRKLVNVDTSSQRADRPTNVTKMAQRLLTEKLGLVRPEEVLSADAVFKAPLRLLHLWYFTHWLSQL